MRRRSPVLLRAAVVIGFAVAMLAPLICLLLYSVADRFSVSSPLPAGYTSRWFRAFADDPRGVGALWTSLKLASCATAAALALGLPLAWALARRRVIGGAVLESTVLLRSAVPVIVLGLGTAAFLYRVGAIDTWPALIAAHAAGGLPFVAVSVRPAISALDSTLLDAAQDVGAGPLRRFCLAMRLIAPAIAAAGLYAFLFSLDEFGLTFLISGINIVTLPVLLYEAVQSSSVSAASAIAVVLLVPSLLTGGLGFWIARRTGVMARGASA